MAKLTFKDWGIFWPTISLLGFAGGCFGIYTGVSVIRRELALARLKQDWKTQILPPSSK